MAHLGELRGFSRTGLSSQHDHLVLRDGGDDLVAARRDGEVGGIVDDWHGKDAVPRDGGQHTVGGGFFQCREAVPESTRGLAWQRCLGGDLVFRFPDGDGCSRLPVCVLVGRPDVW